MKKFFFSAALFFLLQQVAAQLPSLYYDFENNTTRTTFENLVEQSINSGSGALVRAGNTTTISGVSGAGAFNGGSANGQALTGSNWSAVTTDPGTLATDYYQFVVNTTGFSGISIQFDNQASATGPARAGILYSTDGSTFFTTAVSPVLTGNAVFSASGNLSLPAAADNQGAVTIRIYAYAGSAADRATRSAFGSGGTFRIDNLMVLVSTATGSKTLLDHAAIGLSIKSGTAYNPSYSSFTITSGAACSTASALILTGALTVNSAGSIVLSGALTTGDLTIGAASTFNLSGNLATVNGNMIQGGTLLHGSGTIDFGAAAGTQTLASGGTGIGKTFYIVTHSGAGTLQLSTNNLKIVNSLTNNAGPLDANGLNINVGADLSMNGNYVAAGGVLTFDGSSNQGWTGNGVNDYGNVVINKSSGDVQLNSAVTLNNLTLTQGKLQLGNFNLIVGGSITGGSASNYVQTNGTGSITINNITSSRIFPIGNSTYNPLTIANGSGLNWTAKLTDAVNNVLPPFSTSKAILRTWTITPSVNPPGAGADLSFQYDDSDPGQKGASFNTAEDVQLWHYGIAWVAASGAMTPTGSPGGIRTITKTNWSYYSSFAIANISGPPPVGLTHFSGYRNGSRDLLKWTTVFEQNNRGFEVQQSADGINYTVANFVHSLAWDGNSNTLLHYSLEVPAQGDKQYYRLRQVDLDDKDRFSQVLLIRSLQDRELNVRGPFPNPVKDKLNLSITTASDLKANLVVSNTTGVEVFRSNISLEKGVNALSVDLPPLSIGVYFLVISLGEEKRTIRFLKTEPVY